MLSFQVARLVYDVTVRFCDLYIDKFSRTRDQMIQAARSGVQNIAEGSMASGTSKKTELKLTNVARASLEELRLDYEDYLRQGNMVVLSFDDPIMKRFKTKKCKTVDDVREWVNQEMQIAKDSHRQTLTDTSEVKVFDSPCQSLSSSALVANGMLASINLASYLLSRQISVQAESFESEGGFTERLYRVRTSKRKQRR